MSFGLEETGPEVRSPRHLTDLIEPGSLLEATPECLVVARSDGLIVYANRHAEELTGFSRDELVGSSIELLIAADLLELPAGSRIEATCRRAGLAPIPIHAHVGTLEVPEPLLVVALRDVSELQAGREAAFEAEAKYRSLVEHIPAVVYLIFALQIPESPRRTATTSRSTTSTGWCTRTAPCAGSWNRRSRSTTSTATPG